MREGWKCPVCGQGVSPDEKRCDHGNGAVTITTPFAIPDTNPLTWEPSVWPDTLSGNAETKVDAQALNLGDYHA